jgi:hypothetical protein
VISKLPGSGSFKKYRVHESCVSGVRLLRHDFLQPFPSQSKCETFVRSGLRSENRLGRSRHIPDRRSIQYCGPFKPFQPFNRFALFKTLNSEMQPGRNWRYSTGFAGALTREAVVVG